MSATPLARLLEGHATRPDALAAFRVARREFLRGRRLEMQELAAELGVSRATVYRWVGGRDPLLVEVIWSITAPTLDSATVAADGLRGGARIAAVVDDFAAAVIASQPFMEFVQHEPERALRLLTTRASAFQSRLVAVFEALLRQEIERGHLDPPLPLHDLAYVTVRLTETFVYADAIAGATPDPIRASQAVGALLRD